MSGPDTSHGHRLARRAISALRWRAEKARLRRGLFSPRVISGEPAADGITVTVCLWNRRDRIDDVLELLDSQDTDRRLNLQLWNNQPRDAGHYLERIRAFRRTGALASVALYTSGLNVGGMGRFYLARKVRRTGYRGPFIMLDDDQDVSPSFVEDLLRASGARRIAGFWAWTMSGDYWARVPAEVGQRVSYVGTGGCVCDIDIVENDDFFTGLPRYFAFLEDLWMCGYARKRGWSLAKVDTPVRFVLDETNQHHTLGELKAEFYRYLELDDPR